MTICIDFLRSVVPRNGCLFIEYIITCLVYHDLHVVVEYLLHIYRPELECM